MVRVGADVGTTVVYATRGGTRLSRHPRRVSARRILTGATITILALAIAATAVSAAPRTKLMSQSTSGDRSTEASGSADINATGNLAVFHTEGDPLGTDSNGRSDIYVRNVSGKKTTLVSRARNGGLANGASHNPAVSANGRYVVFGSSATNLTAATGTGSQIYRRDLLTRTTALGSKGAHGAANAGALSPAISANGRYVAFRTSAANLTSKNTFGQSHVYLRDMVKKKTFLISQAGGVGGNALSAIPVISADGRFVAFHSEATNLSSKDERGKLQVFLRDRKLNRTFLISKNSKGKAANGYSGYPAMSADGRSIVFESAASNLIKWGTDSNGQVDVYKYDRGRKTMSRVSLNWRDRQLNDTSLDPDISANGTVITFWSPASNTIKGRTNGKVHIYRRGPAASSIRLVGRTNGGQQANGGAQTSALSANGKYVAYVSAATNLGNDTNGKNDVFRTGPF